MKPDGFLSNMRFICLPSEKEGEDWMEKASEIDRFLSLGQWELAEESVYILFNQPEVQVARPVIGPRVAVERPFMLIDWTTAPVERKLLQGLNWGDIFDQISNEKAERSFILCLKRRLGSSLELSVEVIFLS